MSDNILQSPLGKKVAYVQQYAPDLLFAISRKVQRQEINITNTLPFQGVDVWNAYELSWLNEQGKPIVAMAEFTLPCESTHLIESKSLKLYLNSFSDTIFINLAEVEETLHRDLSQAAGAAVKVKVLMLDQYQPPAIEKFTGQCLDDLNIVCNQYQVDPEFLRVEQHEVEEVLYSHLLRSNCLVTGQPDIGSVCISYAGKKIDHEGLLKYIVSFRHHQGFHEQCVEMIFVDIMQRCQPKHLTVQACYLRRGGIDINPYRTTGHDLPGNIRLLRQ